MLSIRRLLQARNPELIAWGAQRWQTWLLNQRDIRKVEPGRRLIVQAALTCLQDLPLHVALMQLLTIATRLTLVLTLPTKAAAQLLQAQARREEWEMLVHITDRQRCDDLLRRLPADVPIATFAAPMILSASELQTLARFCRRTDAPAAPGPVGTAYIGYAADYRSWLETSAGDATPQLHELMDADVDGLPIASADAETLIAECSSGLPMATKARQGQVEIPQLGPGDQLIIADLTDQRGSSVIAIQSGELADSDQPLKIRMPARFLTQTPKLIRLELRSSEAHAADLHFHVPPHGIKPWMLSAFLNRGGAGNRVIRAFAEGVGCRIAYAEDEPEVLRDIPVVWGVLRDSDRIIAQAKVQRLYFFYVDHAYFNRGHGKSYRITRNGYEAGGVRDCPEDRLNELRLNVAPWRKGGREIIICPPTEYFAQAHGCADWLETTLGSLRSLTDRPIVVREKPRPGHAAAPLNKALETAHALVTHSSNVAIEAACLGTPVFVSPASAAAPVGRTAVQDIESPVYPDRQRWLAHLAYNQFSFEEIVDGRAWRLLLQLEERALV